MSDETCYWCNGQGCGQCTPALDTTPAGIVRYAADRLNAGGIEIVGDYDLAVALADLLIVLGDEMGDERATEQECPGKRPHWQVVDEYGKGWVEHTTWHEALKVSRKVLGLPDPNAAEVTTGGAL